MATNPAVPEFVEERLDALFAPYARTDAPGYCVGVRQHGRLIYRKAFGMASLELGVANTPRTRMRIGSTTKHFVALLALMLEAEGRLRLDDTVRLHIPELPPRSVEPTLRQLVTHTSGLRCYIDLSFLARGMAMMAADDVLPLQARQSRGNYPPGERMIYCNSGYMLLSKVVERATGQALPDLLRERVFAPMGMHDTVAITTDYALLPGAATLHVKLADGSYRRGIFPQEAFSGDGNIVSTLDDMLDWLAHLRAPGRVGTPAMFERMTTPCRLDNGTLHRYCLGLQRTPYRGVETIQHAGAVIGGSAQMQTVPAHALDIVIMSNGGPLSPTKLALHVIDAVLGDAVLGPRATMARTADFGDLVGRRYRTRGGIVFGFADAKGELGLSLFGHDAVPLRLEGSTLRLEFEDAAVGPLAIEAGAGAPDVLQFGECGNVEPARRIPDPYDRGATTLAALAGRYDVPDLDATATLEATADGGRLHIHAAGGETTLALEPIADDVLLWKNVDPLVPFVGAFVVRDDGALVLNSVRTRALLFLRRT
ncbi:CubicO group peptidase, beta-lactamase class C family [Massilia sp. PDC64]|nr:serine hydrolase domain-containing protein [Massilia sp. PDC64]SDE80016.1 CubicO group peptidase, beta-lactamase class C family [Massilia sp. PDC64]